MKFAVIFTLLISLNGWAKWSVSTYNIRNFDKDPYEGAVDLAELGKIIKDIKSDVMAFEEVINTKAFDTLIKENLPGYVAEISKCGGFGKQQLAIVYNPKIFQLQGRTEDLSFSGKPNGCGSLRPVLLVTLKHLETGESYTFGAVHLKAGGDDRAFRQRWEQYNKLEALSKSYKQTNLILLGDFNTTGYNIHDTDFVRFESFISAAGLRTMSENIGCTNYWPGTLGGEEYQSSILDHIVVQDKLASSVKDVRVGAHCARTACRPATPADLGISFQKVSDHCPVQVSFK